MTESPSVGSSPTVNLRARDAGPPPGLPDRHDPIPVESPPPVAPSARLSCPAPPERVGNYDVLGEVGRGGMGVVYKARHRELGRVVALKMILGARFACVEDVTRFRLEGEAAACLQHPNIVQVFEVGTHEGQPYLALEYVEGGTLRERIASGALLHDQAARLIETLARAVHVAHAQGIIHRDLKPGNVLLSFSREPPASATPALAEGSRLNEVIPKITDFGLAKQLDREGTTLTEAGRVLGTPEYMAPEQASGQASQVGPPTDVYSLGAILYELLTGRPPFEFGGCLDAMLQVVIRDPVPPRRFNPSVPTDLETICLECLRKEPQKRYPSAYELAEDLRRFRQSLPIHARPVGPVERAWKWARRRPVVAGLVASLVLVTLLGFAGVTAALVYALEGWRQAATQRNLADEERVAADAERKAAREERDKSLLAEGRERQARERAEANVAFGRLARALLEWRQNNLAASQSLLGQIDGKRRGWEWGYLDALHHGELQAFTRPALVNVLGLSFHPDGRHLAAGGGNPYHRRGDRTFPSETVIWDLQSGRSARVLTGFSTCAHHVAYSPDGKYLAACADEGRIRVWDSATGTLVRLVQGKFGAARDLAWTPDSKTLYAACPTPGILGWEVATGKPVRPPHLSITCGRCVAVSPDGRLLVGGSGGVRLWDLATGKPRWAIEARAQRVAFSPDSRWVACASGELVCLYDVADGRQVRSFGGHHGPVASLAFSPCGQLLVTGGADATVRVWDVDEGRELSLWRGHHGRVESVAFHPGGAMVASGSAQPGEVKVWDLTRKQEHLCIANIAPQRPVHALAFDPGGAEILLQRAGGSVQARDANTGMERSSRQLPLTRAWRTPGSLGALSGDTRTLAAVDATNTNQVRLWDPRSGKPLRGSHAHAFPAWQVAVSHDGDVVASAAMDPPTGDWTMEVAVWEPAAGRVRFTRKQAGVAVTSLALSRDSRRVALGLMGKETVTDPKTGKSQRRPLNVVELWDADGPGASEPALRVRLGTAMVLGLAFSADGSSLVGCTVAGELYHWELPSGRPLFPEPIHGPVGLEGLAFSPDGRLLAGASRNLVTVWDIREGHEVLRLRGAPPRPSDAGYSPRVAWSRDGRKLAASNWDHSVSVWEAPAPAEREKWARAEARLPRWHLDHADRAIQRKAPAAARFHLEQLARCGELEPGWCLSRGELFARMGEWEKARADFVRAMPDVSGYHGEAWRKNLMLRLRGGDRDGYRHLCGELVATVARGSDVFTPMHVALAAAAIEGAVADPVALVGLARQAVNQAQEHARAHQGLALACLRAGQYGEAVAAARQAPDESPILTWLILTLAKEKLGDALGAAWCWQQARERLAEVRAKMAREGRPTPAGVSWCDWLLMEVLEAEARGKGQ